LKNSILKNLEIGLLYDPAILLPGIDTKELKAKTQTDYLYTYIYDSIIYNSKRTEVIQVSINLDRWISKGVSIYIL
jgi:hypothetical protein